MTSPIWEPGEGMGRGGGVTFNTAGMSLPLSLGVSFPTAAENDSVVQ